MSYVLSLDTTNLAVKGLIWDFLQKEMEIGIQKSKVHKHERDEVDVVVK